MRRRGVRNSRRNQLSVIVVVVEKGTGQLQRYPVPKELVCRPGQTRKKNEGQVSDRDKELKGEAKMAVAKEKGVRDVI